MNHIGGFFSKLKSAFAGLENKKEVIAAVCLNHAKTPIRPEQIEIQGQTVRLNISPAAKSAIFLKKTVILEELSEKIKPPLTNIN